MLQIRNLVKTYPNGVHALKDLSLDVPRGMFGLLGPNGAGKSSLMRTIATLQAPDTGSIRLGDLDVLADPMAVRRRLGYLPQEFGSYPRTSPWVMLNHLAVLKGLHSRSERVDQIEALLKQTNLWDVRRKSIDTFSGGMRQRFGIAQALLGAPELIIVDEPTAGLDPAERRRFHNLLAEIGESVIVILSTHIVDDVADLCPRMAIMGSGRILLEGAPLELVRALDGQLFRRLCSHEEARAISARMPVVSTRMVAGRIEVRVVAGQAPDADFEPVAATVEDLYFHTLATATGEPAAPSSPETPAAV
ncbi:MAG: ABC transporter ATP-binding protein [Pseudomonadota bacterium]